MYNTVTEQECTTEQEQKCETEYMTKYEQECTTVNEQVEIFFLSKHNCILKIFGALNQ